MAGFDHLTLYYCVVLANWIRIGTTTSPAARLGRDLSRLQPGARKSGAKSVDAFAYNAYFVAHAAN